MSFRLAMGHELWQGSLLKGSPVSSSVVNVIAIIVCRCGVMSLQPC